MALLFWDVIYAKIPGVYSEAFGDFPSKMQDMPRDLFGEEFYPRRGEIIKQRFRSLQGSGLFRRSEKNISVEIRNAYKAHHGKPCRLIDWNRYGNVEQLELAGNLLSMEQLEGIMNRLLVDFSNNRRGLPDLFLSCRGEPIFSEIKSQHESVRDEQLAWLKFLREQLNLTVEICRVRST